MTLILFNGGIMKIHVSKGNKKIGKVINISLVPIESCVPGVPCSKECYARQSYLQYPVVRQAWGENYHIVQTDMNSYFNQIGDHLKQSTCDVFRWHVGGDIQSQEYLNSMYGLANDFPYVKFLAFTKNFNLNFKGMPRNTSIVASMWMGWGDASVDLPKAWVQDKNHTETRIPHNAIECQGDCENCMKCWYLKDNGYDVYFHMH